MATTIKVCGRGGGKTYDLASWILEQVHSNPESYIVCVVRNQEAGFIVDMLLQHTDQREPLNYRKSSGKVDFTNGAKLDFVDPDMARNRHAGWSYGSVTAICGERLSTWHPDVVETVDIMIHRQMPSLPSFFASEKPGENVMTLLGDQFTATTTGIS